MDHLTILQALIERVTPQVGDICDLGFGYWEGSPQQAIVEDLGRSGRLHLTHALTKARAAIESGDPEKVVFAALICPTYERAGLQLAAQHALDKQRQQQREVAHALRVAGGRATGAIQRTHALKRWEPIRSRYAELLAQGKKPIDARCAVREEFHIHDHDDHLRKKLRMPNSGR
jgi:hypothetical protein